MKFKFDKKFNPVGDMMLQRIDNKGIFIDHAGWIEKPNRPPSNLRKKKRIPDVFYFETTESKPNDRGYALTLKAAKVALELII